MGDNLEMNKSIDVLEFPMELVNNKYLLLGGLYSGQLQVINIETGQSEVLQHNRHTITVVKADKEDNQLITGDLSGQLIIYHLQKHTHISSNMAHLLLIRFRILDSFSSVQFININIDMKLFAVASASSLILYNYITANKIKALNFQHPVLSLLLYLSPLPGIVVFLKSHQLLSYSLNG